MAALHRLIRWGGLRFAINLATGILFVSGDPYSYIFRSAFQFKVLFILLAGINALVFYLTALRHGEVLQPGGDMPLRFKIIGGTSLFLWIAVMVCGRVLPVFRPYGPLRPLF